MKELTHFRDAVRRDLIADGMSRPNPMEDRELLNKLANYGNEYLERYKEPGVIIWFDFYFGDPAVLGMTWAYNPNAPYDRKGNDYFFWRIWSETDHGSEVYSLKQCQEEFAAYCVQRPQENTHAI